MPTSAARDLAGERTQFGELLGRSPTMRALFEESARAALRPEPLLLLGESGTGKNALARAIHRESARRDGPLVTLDCGASALALLEDELFGRSESISGGRAGALERAQGGTLLLDDIAELPPTLQARLEQVLVSRQLVRAIGGATSLDLRVLGAARRKLAIEVARGRFRPTLGALFGETVLTLPPLRERREDIPLLAQALLERLDEGRGLAFSAEALGALAQHDWPGNVRELRNVVERLAYALRAGGAPARWLGTLLLSGELPAFESGPTVEARTFDPGLSYREERARFEAAFERRYVAWLLERHDGNISAGARAADMDRKYLYKLARKHGLKSTPDG